jgi:acylphosphatase
MYIEKTTYICGIVENGWLKTTKNYLEESNLNDEESKKAIETNEKIKKSYKIKMYIEKIENDSIYATLNGADETIKDFAGFIKDEKVKLNIISDYENMEKITEKYKKRKTEGFLYDFFSKKFIVVFGKERDLIEVVAK